MSTTDSNWPKVVDCDTHFWQPLALWEKYIDPEFRDEIARIRPTLDPVEIVPMASAAAAASVSGPGIKGKYFKGMSGVPGLRAARMKERGGDYPDARIEWMDGEGIDICIIYPSFSASLMVHPNGRLAAAACRALNRWSAEFANHNPKRLKPCMLLPWYDVELAIEELHYAIGLGMNIAFSTPTPSASRRWSDPAYDPLWRAMQDNKVVLAYHDFTSGLTDVPSTHIARASYKDMFAARYLCGHTLEQQMTLMDLMYGGVFSRFPALRIGFVEAHVAWLPGWLAMLDLQWERSLSGFDNLEGWGDTNIKPTEMFKRQGFAVAFPDDNWVYEVINMIGADNFTICTDYPHPAARYGMVKTFDANFPGMDPALRAKLMSENAVRIFNLA